MDGAGEWTKMSKKCFMPLTEQDCLKDLQLFLKYERIY